MKQLPFLSTYQAIILLRITVSLLMIAHGIMRIYAGTVDNFGEFLSIKGFPAGVITAWSITVFEIVGGLILITGHLRQTISLLFILELLTGIILVHVKNGWFVVGHSSGGVEYSILLVISFLVVAATGNKDV